MRRVCTYFAAGVLFLSFGVTSLFAQNTSPVASGSTTTSVDKIGTHLIQGDEGGQQAVLNQLSSRAIPSNYPVVVMVDANSGSGANLLSQNGGKFAMIARVNITCETTPSALSKLAARIPAGVPVTIGNEINNQNPNDGEWKCDYSKYADLFNEFAAAFGRKGPLGIAPMDTINGDFDAAVTLQKIFNTAINKGEITAVFANVYLAGSCKEGYDPSRCSTTAWQWVQSELSKYGVSGDLYITEFGTVVCGDYDCIQEFYEKNNGVIPAKLVVGFTRPPGQSTGTTWVHTVPAVCEYWEGGSLAVQRPSKCGGGEAQFYLYPGIDDQRGDAREEMAARYMVSCGSLQAVKGTLDNVEYIDKETDGVTYENTFPGGPKSCDGKGSNNACLIMDAVGTVLVNNEAVAIPLYRLETATAPNPNEPTRRTEDLSGYFSAAYTGESGANKTIQQSLEAPLANGVSKKLVSKTQQCEDTITFLEHVKTMCDRPQPPKDMEYLNAKDKNGQLPSPLPSASVAPGCALDAKIPEVSGQYDSYLKVLSRKPSGFVCSENPGPTVSNQEWYKAFSRIELTTQKGFKPAYVVTYDNRQGSKEQWSRNPLFTKVLNWSAPGTTWRQGPGIPDYEVMPHRIRVTRLYVPAGFAEQNKIQLEPEDDPETTAKFKLNNAENIYPKYDSGFSRSMQSLFSRQELISVEKERKGEILEVLRRMKEPSIRSKLNSPNSQDEVYIRCPECTSDDNADIQLLAVHRINAELFDGGATNIVGEAMKDGQACYRPIHLTGEKGQSIRHTLNPLGNPDPVKTFPRDFAATLQAVSTGFSVEESLDAHVRTYLLLPEEFRTIHSYEKQLVSRFLPYTVLNDDNRSPSWIVRQDQESFISDTTRIRGYKYLQLSGSTMSITANPIKRAEFAPTKGSATGKVGNDLTQTTCVDEITGAEYDCTGAGQPHFLEGQLELSRPSANVNPQIPGGRLSRTLWYMMCEVLLPHDDGTTRAPYQGFEKLLTAGQDWPKLCRQQDRGTTDAPPTNTNLCGPGTTEVPSSFDALFSLFENVANSTGIPVHILWGVFRIEGTPTYQAVYDGRSNLVCEEANSVGAVGPMGILVKACGGPFGNWEENASRAGVADKTPCDLEASLRVAAAMLKRSFSGPSQTNCAVNYPSNTQIPTLPSVSDQGELRKWIDAAASYNGSCMPLQPRFGCTHQGKNLTYGECAVVKFAPGFGKPQR